MELRERRALGWWATPRRKAWRLTSLPRPLRRPGFQAELPEPSPGRAIQCQLTRCPRVPRPHTRRAGAGSPRGPPHGTPDDVSTAPRKYRRGGGGRTTEESLKKRREDGVLGGLEQTEQAGCDRLTRRWDVQGWRAAGGTEGEGEGPARARRQGPARGLRDPQGCGLPARLADTRRPASTVGGSETSGARRWPRQD